MEKKLLLIESFRAVLRARYLARPGLADEVENADYFRPPFDGSTRPIEEVQAVRDAADVLKDAIANQSVRLCGRLETSERPADIDPTEIRREGISIFKNELDVWQPSTGTRPFRQLPNYLNVHCYAADIEALIGASDAAVTAADGSDIEAKLDGVLQREFGKPQEQIAVDETGHHHSSNALLDAAADLDPPPRDTAEEACRKLIVSLDSSGLTKAVIFERARKQIPDLQPVEFDRAWFNGANLLKKRGRRKVSI